VEVFINTLHILKGNLLPQHHLVERANEERVQETAVENGQTNDPTDEFEVVQMFRINTGVRINL
jgi:hypothetical protein